MASINAVGGTIYANQGMVGVANEQANLQNKFELQSLAATQRQKDKQVEEVKPAVESQSISDNDSNKEEFKEKNKKRILDKGKPKEEEGKHILDIRV